MDSHYGGFWRRFVALSIDLCILGTIGFTMLILGSVAFGLGVSPEEMAADPETQRWWDVCKPCQQPLASRREGEWWSEMEEVFHLD